MHEPHKLGADAHRLVQEFVALPEQDRVRSNELLVELECVIAEFKKTPPGSRVQKTDPLAGRRNNRTAPMFDLRASDRP